MLSKGFLGVIAVGAVTLGGWVFWEEAWPPILDVVYDPHYDTLYWDASQDGDTITIDYTYTGDDSPKAYVDGQIAYYADVWSDSPSFTVEPGSHSCALPGFLKDCVDRIGLSGEFKAVRTASGRPPAR